ncbi:minor capsid protein [Capybara microvirus Cap1_SP_135]|nr:minor capsid protein [Capybara microvirus Cap1_SP_135]
MEPIVSSALIGGATDIVNNVGSIIGQSMANKANSLEAEKNRQWQSSEREAQNQWNLEQWNRENEYNSAKQQLVRMAEAGLNPYGTDITPGTANALQSASVGSVGNPHMENVAKNLNLGAGIKNMADVTSINANTSTENLLRNSRLQQVQENTNLLRQEAIAKGLGSDYQRIINQFAGIEKMMVLKQAELDQQKTKVDTKVSEYQLEKLLPQLFKQHEAEIKKLGLENDLQAIMNKYAPAKAEAELSEKRAQAKALQGEYDRLQYEVQTVLPERVRNMIKEGKNIDLDSELKKLSQPEKKILIEKYMAEINKLSTDVQFRLIDSMDSGIMGSGISVNNIRTLIYDAIGNKQNKIVIPYKIQEK